MLRCPFGQHRVPVLTSEIIAGFLSAWVVIYVVVGLFSVVAHVRQKRSEREPGYLAFGLLAFALALFDAGLAATHVAESAPALSVALRVAEVGRIGSAACLLHVGLDQANVRFRARVLPLVYGVAGGFVIANALGLLHRVSEAPREISYVLGVAHPGISAHPTAGAVAIAWIAAAEVLAAAVLFGRAFTPANPEGLGAFVGGAALTTTAVHDALASPGLRFGPLLSPYGYAAFVLGVLWTIVWRYAALRRQLEKRTQELQDLTKQLEQRSRELARSVDDLRAAQTDLVRKEQLAAIGELSAVVAHEVRNPLAIITTAVATLRRGTLASDDRDTLLGILDEESSRLNDLVGDLLVYAKPMSVERQRVMVRDVVERALAIVGNRADVVVEIVEAEPAGGIWGDPNLLRQAIENIVTNALQAMAGSGTLTVRIFPAEVDGMPGIELQIEDTGEGMDTTVRSRAMDPFFTTRPRGTGLGLAIVRRIIEAHGGRLRIESAAGAGTLVHVVLPRGNEGAISRRVAPPERLDPRQTPMPSVSVEPRARKGGA